MPILQPRIDEERGYTEADMQIGADVDKSLSTLIGAPDKFIDNGIQEIYKNASRNGYFNEQFTIDDVRSRYDELVNQQREPKVFGGQAARAIIKLISKHKDNIEVKKLSKEIEKEQKKLDKLEDKMKDQQDSYIGDTYVDEIGFDSPRNREDWEYISGNIEELEDNLEEKLLELEGVGVYNPSREDFQEGGNVDAQMAEMMPDDQMIAEAQAEDFTQEGMVPDEEMEDNYVDFIIGESLSMDDEEYLMATLNEDERLSMIFDQVIETASEFSGSGPVEGPGTGISDSIPARLSDGEFVITAKATEEIGPDELQSMMEQAEMNADVRQMRQVGGYIQEEEEDQSIQAVKTAARPKQTGQGLMPEQLQDRENKKNMMMLNPRNTLLAR